MGFTCGLNELLAGTPTAAGNEFVIRMNDKITMNLFAPGNCAPFIEPGYLARKMKLHSVLLRWVVSPEVGKTESP